MGCELLGEACTRIVDLLWSKIEQAFENEAIKELISYYLMDEKNKHESQRSGAEYDFSFDCLPEVILEAILKKDTLWKILDVQGDHSENEKKRIYDLCISVAGAESEPSKHKITTIVNNCFGIIEAYYIKKKSVGDLVCNKRLADGINEHADKIAEIQNRKFDDVQSDISKILERIPASSTTSSPINPNSMNTLSAMDDSATLSSITTSSTTQHISSDISDSLYYDFREESDKLLQYCIDKDPCAEPLSTSVYDEIDNLQCSWKFKIRKVLNLEERQLMEEVLQTFSEYNYYISEKYMRIIRDGEYVIAKHQTIEESIRLQNELMPKTYELREKMAELYKKLWP